MAVFRVEKTRDYTVMSNQHLRDRALSLKAKGLLSLMLSLPEDWDYTTKGLARICKDGVDSICSTVRELEGAGYVVRQRQRRGDGALGGIEYTILEQPRKANPPERDFPEQAKPVQGQPAQEKPAQLNTKGQSTKRQNTDASVSFPSVPRKSVQGTEAERQTYRALLRENVGYDELIRRPTVDVPRLDELLSLMLDTVCSTRATLRVAGEELPTEVVRSRLLKLTGDHLLYVLKRLSENTTEVRCAKQYLLTALYNAPLTMDNHYALMVGHDMNNSG